MAMTVLALNDIKTALEKLIQEESSREDRSRSLDNKIEHNRMVLGDIQDQIESKKKELAGVEKDIADKKLEILRSIEKRNADANKLYQDSHVEALAVQHDRSKLEVDKQEFEKMKSDFMVSKDKLDLKLKALYAAGITVK